MTTPTSTTNDRLGEVKRDEAGVQLQFVRSYDASIEEVWSAVTEPERMARWFGGWSGDPATGQVQFEMPMKDGSQTEAATIDVCEPPTALAVTIATPDGPWPLNLTLTAEGDRTVLRFTHRLNEPYDASGVGPGWQYYLDRLGAVLAGEPVPDDFDAYYPRLADSYPIPAATS
jgi:uncharacterized protein YndB with AHSA1/START domain